VSLCSPHWYGLPSKNETSLFRELFTHLLVLNHSSRACACSCPWLVFFGLRLGCCVRFYFNLPCTVRGCLHERAGDKIGEDNWMYMLKCITAFDRHLILLLTVSFLTCTEPNSSSSSWVEVQSWWQFKDAHQSEQACTTFMSGTSGVGKE